MMCPASLLWWMFITLNTQILDMCLTESSPAYHHTAHSPRPLCWQQDDAGLRDDDSNWTSDVLMVSTLANTQSSTSPHSGGHRDRALDAENLAPKDRYWIPERFCRRVIIVRWSGWRFVFVQSLHSVDIHTKCYAAMQYAVHNGRDVWLLFKSPHLTLWDTQTRAGDTGH